MKKHRLRNLGIFFFYIWMKIKLWFQKINLKYPHLKWVILGILIAGVALLISWLIFLRPVSAHYYYIDYEGNRGVADKCWIYDGGLICNREYGGKIQVMQYWRGD